MAAKPKIIPADRKQYVTAMHICAVKVSVFQEV